MNEDVVLWKDGDIKKAENTVLTQDVFVAMSTKNSINVETLNSLDRAGLRGQLHIIRTAYMDAARNDAVAQFLKSKCKYLLWVDDDNDVPENIMQLFDRDEPCLAPINWQMFEEKGKTIIIPGVSWWLSEKLMPMVNFMSAQSLVAYRNLGNRWIDGPTSVSGGVWAIRRDVFEDTRVIDKDGEWFKSTWVSDSGKTLRSEDNHWFYKLWKAGYSISVDLTIEAGHYKRVNLANIAREIYGGNLDAR